MTVLVVSFSEIYSLKMSTNENVTKHSKVITISDYIYYSDNNWLQIYMKCIYNFYVMYLFLGVGFFFFFFSGWKGLFVFAEVGPTVIYVRKT